MAKKQKSVMTSGRHFSQVPHANIQRSKFDRSHGYKTTFDAGKLIPFYVDEALPGDTFNLNATLFARLATPLKPIMDNMFLETFFFAVPNRLVWDNWQKFNGEQDNPDDSVDFVIPTLASHNHSQGSIADYMGIPIGIDGLKINALHHRSYALIFNEWFRDQNLQTSITIHKDDGPDNSFVTSPLRRGKRHDYFTSCLPWPQKHDSVEISIGGDAPVLYPANDAWGLEGHSNTGQLWSATDSTTSGDPLMVAQTVTLLDNQSIVPNGWIADLSTATAITINQLRESFQIQKMYERDARGGTRYTEIIKSHFGVTSPDSRLQRPEFLGGGSSSINVTAIAQTAQSTDGTQDQTPQGNLAGVGTAVSNRNGFTKSFTEHCTIIGLLSVRADLTYQQGLNRMFSRQTRFDFYWPSLSHLGEQSVLNKEIYAVGNGVAGQDDEVFGYQERYAEYRYKPSQITGKFRSTDPQSLDFWHLSQEFGNLPVLNSEFIEDNPPIGRVIAVDTEPHFLLDSFINLKCVRPMPTYAVPGLIDHF